MVTRREARHEVLENGLEWLHDRTMVIETDIKNTYIIQEF